MRLNPIILFWPDAQMRLMGCQFAILNRADDREGDQHISISMVKCEEA
jgi:hypothetical protein